MRIDDPFQKAFRGNIDCESYLLLLHIGEYIYGKYVILRRDYDISD